MPEYGFGVLKGITNREVNMRVVEMRELEELASDKGLRLYQMDDALWHIYNEAGQRVEGDFKTYQQALRWLKDNK